METNSSINVLVTGGSGYIGHRIVKALHQLRHTVTSVDKVHPKEKGIKFPKGTKVINGDLKDASVAKRAVRGIDIVVHLAANIGSLTYMHEHQAEILQENCAIDVTLYPAMADAKVKTILYSSSSMVYQRASKYPYTEADLENISPPINVYGLSKLVGEYFCKSFHEQYGLNYVIMRYHNVYGPGEDSKGSTPGEIHVIPALIEKVLSGQYPLEFLGGLNATRPFVYIDDTVEATVRLFKEALKGNSNVVNEDFNIGPKKATKILDLGKLIWDILGDGRPFKYTVKEAKGETSVRREADISKMEKATGWKPKVSLEEGIKHTAAIT
jgi:nucleoside-diphosphate-sugar epimerase